MFTMNWRTFTRTIGGSISILGFMVVLLCRISFLLPLAEQRNLLLVNRYVKSRSDKQLRSGKYTGTECNPVEMDSEGRPIIPCGLIAWSLFNDTYGFTRGSMEIKLRRKDISWKSDREHKFGKNVYPSNFQNGSLIGGGKLNPDVPVSIFIC